MLSRFFVFKLLAPKRLGTIFLLVCGLAASGQYLKVKDTSIVDQNGKNVLLRGVGLGGWMLQEGYMLRFQGRGQQHVIRQKITDLIGAEKTAEFYQAWLDNHTTKADIDSMKAWGFNSVRLPMHYNLYTLPIEKEPVKGKNTWLEQGFVMTDSLLKWCQENEMYLILDLHAAPGGQGNDFNISDRDPNVPSLWDSRENQLKTVALWKKLADRYKGAQWLGAYDLINEPNWGFTDTADRNGLQEKLNKPLRDLMVEITKAIREVDQKTIIIIEGNGWGNNYNGVFPLWDNNLVLSFHKYWNYNTQGSIQQFLDYRKKYNVPIWLGETGENSNVWFTEAISLMERNNIGWCWWPLKKMGINNPIEVKVNSDYLDLLEYWSGKAVKPDAGKAYQTLMTIAANTNIQKGVVHYDVIDAMFRQVQSSETIPFKLNSTSGAIAAMNYDLGRNKAAYFDTDTSEHYISTGTERTGWNMGRAYRNDGVDIYKEGEDEFYVGKIEDGEWLRYTVTSQSPARFHLNILGRGRHANNKLVTFINDQKAGAISFSENGDKWSSETLENIQIKPGKNVVLLFAEKGGFDLKSLEFSK